MSIIICRLNTFFVNSEGLNRHSSNWITDSENQVCAYLVDCDLDTVSLGHLDIKEF